jgi:ACS family sodium-dependent inorganic phosphate cotransporter
VLNIMVILGFMFNYMLRVNLTIAIVAMVIPGNKTDTSHTSASVTECSDPGNATLLSQEPAQLSEVR